MKRLINMMSQAHTVEGQGVGSATYEQIQLVSNGLRSKFKVVKNKFKTADICHYHTINPQYFMFMPFTKSKGKTVCSVHFLPETVDNSLQLPKPIKYLFYKYILAFYKSVDYLVTVNPYFIDKLCDYGIDRKKVIYIPNFVSKNQFYILDDGKKKKTRKKYKIEENRFVVLSAGQLQTRKGIFDFVKIAKKMPEVQFIWAGGFSFGKITDGYEKIREIVSNPPKNIKFLGIVKREDMNEIYNMCDVMLLVSLEELFPMTILESMNCHKPILLRNLEIYENILFDFYLKTDGVDNFVEEIKKLENDTEYYKKASNMSKRGSEFYSKEHVLGLWNDFYTGIING